jgi:hypothetical protein
MTNEEAKGNIRLVILHCRMFEYGFSQTPDTVRDTVGRLYHQFAGLHLISTMFLIDRNDRVMGGFCYRALEPIGLAHLLEPIREILGSSVGDTTFGDFIRRSRNKLTVHGDFSLESLPVAEREVPFDSDARKGFAVLLERLANEIKKLQDELTKLVQE